MFRAKVLLFLGRTKDSCDAIYDASDDIRSQCLIQSTMTCSNLGRHMDPYTRTEELKNTLNALISLNDAPLLRNLKDIQYYPSVVSNYVLCHIAEHGISRERIDDAEILLQSVLTLNRILTATSSDVVVSLQDHLLAIQALKSGATQSYGASFLW